MALHLNTPLIASSAMSVAAGRPVIAKMDALQPSGSFKLRGIGAVCEHHARHGMRRFVSSSGGNAGIAVAYAGQYLTIPVSVFVPVTTSEKAKALIRQHGAEVIVHGASWQEANDLAVSTLDPTSAYVHPFDDLLLWAGHSTLIDEVIEAGAVFDAVVLAVGGGGLLCGVAEGLERHRLAHVPIIAVETRGAASLSASMAAGERVELPAITSIATSLGARQVCQHAFEITRNRPVKSVVVDDDAAVAACIRFLDESRVLVEPACGAALAIAYQQADQLAAYRQVLMVVCGGATASLAQLLAWQALILPK